MFYLLPNEIQGYIYEFDDTYREYFTKNVLVELKSTKIYKDLVKNNYILVNLNRNLLSVTNNLANPYYILRYSKWSESYIQRKLRQRLFTRIFPNDNEQDSLETIHHRYSENMVQLLRTLF